MSKSFKIAHIRKSFKIDAYYPKNPKAALLFQNEFYANGVNEDQVWDFYDRVKHKLVKQAKGKHTLLWVSANEGTLKRKNDGFIHIDNTNDFNRLNNGKMVELHPAVAYKKGSDWFTDIIFCALDPKEHFGWKETKAATKDIYNIFRKDTNIKKATIHFSGDKGFHVSGRLRTSWDVNKARDYTKKLLKPLVTDKVKLGVVKESDMIRLDTSPLKRRGSARASWSLNKDTGLVAIPVDIKNLDKFEKKHATIKKAIECFNRKSFKNQMTIGRINIMITDDDKIEYDKMAALLKTAQDEEIVYTAVVPLTISVKRKYLEYDDDIQATKASDVAQSQKIDAGQKRAYAIAFEKLNDVIDVSFKDHVNEVYDINVREMSIQPEPEYQRMDWAAIFPEEETEEIK